jgi:putative flippase GtrA
MLKSLVNQYHKFKKPLKFLLFGGIAAAVELLTFVVFCWFLEVYLAALFSFLCGLGLSFIFNKVFVFQSTAQSKLSAGRELIYFACLGAFNSQISSLATTALSLVIPSVAAKVITMAFIAAWNYLIMGKVIFNNKNKKPTS